MDTRQVTIIAAALFSLTAVVAASESAAKSGFGFAAVEEKARALAATPYEPPPERVPSWLREISYDEWRDIRFQPSESLWRKEGLPFEAQFFHPGLFYDRPVDIHVVDADGSHPIPFSPSFFNYGRNNFASRVPQDVGFAGFRLHFPINREGYKDELVAFLGASYFRALAKDTVYGISARGLAVDTALPSGEEFPYFREFWMVRPARAAKDMALYALLDSPRITGAYRFVIHPGVETKVDVEATLYPRDTIEKLGIAPLTSMFFFGENTLSPPIDYRPEVHDSDGLLMAMGSGEWIWRPLGNPGRLRVSTFAAEKVRGFGLLQRDRQFAHFQDLETNMQQRPSVWIEPRGEWGPGHVELIEIPTRDETNDNIVAFWVPAKKPIAGEPISMSYRTTWFGPDTTRSPGGKVVATRHDRGTLQGGHRIVVDFSGKKLGSLPPDTVLEGVVSVTPVDGAEATLLEQQVQKNPHLSGWRLTMQIQTDEDGPVELRAFLRQGSDVLTETWSYVVEP
jgi:glucans biosynthesis protein